MNAAWKIAVAFAIALAAGVAGRDVPLDAQLPVFDLMITVASIILAITGAWLAVVYPAVLEGLYKPGLEHRAGDLKKTRRLFVPMATSSVMIMTGLLIHIVCLILQHNDALSELVTHSHRVLRGFSFALLVTLSGTSLVSLMYCLAPAAFYDRDLSAMVGRDERIKRMQSRNARVNDENKAA